MRLCLWIAVFISLPFADENKWSCQLNEKPIFQLQDSTYSPKFWTNLPFDSVSKGSVGEDSASLPPRHFKIFQIGFYKDYEVKCIEYIEFGNSAIFRLIGEIEVTKKDSNLLYREIRLRSNDEIYSISDYSNCKKTYYNEDGTIMKVEVLENEDLCITKSE